MDANDVRVKSGICTPAGAGAIVGMKESTLRSWTRLRGSRMPLVHVASNERRGWPTIPLIGLIEAHIIHVLRTDVGLRMRTIVDFAERLRSNNDEFGFASPDLVTDTIDIYRQEDSELERVHDGQHPLSEVVKPFLRPIGLWLDGRPGAFAPPGLPGLEIDPRFSAGRLSFARNRVPVFAVLGGLSAGESADQLASDYELTRAEVSLVETNVDWLTKVA